MRAAVLLAPTLAVVALQPAFDPARGSLRRAEPQAIYSNDPNDPWNQVFFLLFTRTIDARVAADAPQTFAAGDERLRLTDQRVTRIESGDRATDALYPTWLWMGSADGDFEPGQAWRALQEPRYSSLRNGLEAIRQTAAARSPLARALMQADLWSAHDQLFALTRARPARALAEARERAAVLLPEIAAAIGALALSRTEIARLPDTYAAAVRSRGLPDVFDGNGGWLEIRWVGDRSHDRAAGFRRATRVFMKPARPPGNIGAFLRGFREAQGNDLGRLDSVALVTELLLVARDGTVVPSRLTYEAQFRGTAARTSAGEVPQYELSRRALLTSRSSDGLEPYAGGSPAYLPIAGNDLSFAAPPRLDGEPILARMRNRCGVCHGTGAGVGHLVTFSRTFAPNAAMPDVVRLVSAEHRHARDVAERKMRQEDFAALRRR